MIGRASLAPLLFLALAVAPSRADARGAHSAAVTAPPEDHAAPPREHARVAWLRAHAPAGATIEDRDGVVSAVYVTKKDDSLAPLLKEFDGALPDRFLRDGKKSALGKIRETWQSHLGIEEAVMQAFAKTLRLQLDHLPKPEPSSAAPTRRWADRC